MGLALMAKPISESQSNTYQYILTSKKIGSCTWRLRLVRPPEKRGRSAHFPTGVPGPPQGTSPAFLRTAVGGPLVARALAPRGLVLQPRGRWPQGDPRSMAVRMPPARIGAGPVWAI